MNSFTILTESSCDLPAELAKELQIKVLPLTVSVNGKEYRNELDGSEIGFEEFYRQLGEGAAVSTSALNMETLTRAMESECAAGNDVLYLGFSSALSGTYQTAWLAAKEVAERFTARKLYTVDSKCACMGQGLFVYLAAKQRLAGKSLEEVRDYAQSIVPHLCHWFTVDDLHQLKRGGRVSAATAIVGTMLNIKPVLHVDDNGALIPMSKVKGRVASIQALLRNMKETVTDPEGQVVFISQGNCREDAEKLASMVRAEFGCEVVIGWCGPVIGAHSGQGTLALFYLGSHR